MQDIQQQIFSELDKFQALTDEARKILHEVSDGLDSGYSPNEAVTSRLFASLKGLRKLYEYICSLIASESNSPEISHRELSSSELRKIAAGINESVERAKDDLRRFVMIRSKIEALSVHIKPIQEKAEKLLQRLEAPNLTGGARKSALNEAVKYQKFLAMLDQKLTERNVLKAEELMKIFPPMTILGLTANHYYIHTDGQPAPAEIEPLSESNPPAKTDFEPVPDNDAETDSQPAPAAEVPVTSQPESVQQAPENVSDEDDEIIPPRTPVKPRKAGAKAFREEIIKNAQGLGSDAVFDIRDSLNIFMHYGVLTLDQIYFFRTYYRAWQFKIDSERREYLRENMNPDNDEGLSAVRNILDWLERRRAVSVFIRDDKSGHDAYCLTKWMCESLTKKDVRKSFSGLTPGNFMYSADEGLRSGEASRIMCNNYFILKYMAQSMPYLDRVKFGKVLDGMKCGVGEAVVPVFWENEEYKCRLVQTLNDAEQEISRNGLSDYILISTFDSPEEVNAVLSRIDEKYRNRIFVSDKTFHRGLAEIMSDDDSDSDAPKSQLDFNFDDDEDTVRVITVNEYDEKTGKADISVGDRPLSEVAAVIASDLAEYRASAREKESESEKPSAPEAPSKPRSPADLASHEEESENASGHEKDSALSPRNISLPSDDDFMNEILAMLNDTDCGNDEIPFPPLISALICAKAASLAENHPKCAELFTRINMAVPVMPDTPENTGANLASAFTGNYAGDTVSEGLMLSAYTWAMISPEMPYTDFELKHRVEELYAGYDSFFPSYRECRKVFAAIYEFHRRYSVFPAGFLERGADLGNEDSGILSRIRSEAESLLNVPVFNKDMKLLPFFTREFFGPGSEIYSCLKAVCGNDSGMIDAVRDLTAKYYDANERLSAEKLKDFVDTKWAEVWREKSIIPGKVKPLISHLRTGVIRAAHVRLAVMQRWLDASGTVSADYDSQTFAEARDEILSSANSAAEKMRNAPGKSSVRMMISRICRKLSGMTEPDPFAVLLSNGIIPLDRENLPMLGDPDMKYYEPWRNVLRFMNTPRLTLSQAEEKILYDEDSPMFENLHQLRIIRQIQGKDPDEGFSPDDAQRARESAEKSAKDFALMIDTDYAFGRITEDDAETLKSLAEGNEEIFSLGDFGCWRQFLEALKLQAEDISEERKKEISREIQTCIDANGKKCPEILTEAMRLAKEGSLNAAESYLNRYESARSMGITADEPRTERAKIDTFSCFMSAFGEIYRECDKPRSKEKSLKSLGKSYIEDNPPEGWHNLTRKLRDERTAIIDSWPSRRGNTTPDQVRALVSGLGFSPESGEDSVKRGENNQDFQNMEIFTVKIKRSDGRTCTHPVAKFGTKLESLSVIILYGSGTPEKIVSSVMEREPGASVLIMDYHVSLPVRSQFAKAFRTHGRQDKYFLLVDRVLAIFLTLQDTGSRLSDLLQCTLPYTSCIPFTKGSGYVAPEMFYGRERELADIRNHEGSSVVYGGRQLGKTSLLKRAEALEHQPEKLKFAVYSDLTANGLKKVFQEGYSEAEFSAGIIRSVNAKIPGLLSVKSSTLQAVCDDIESLISSKKAESFMLLLDEADAFLDSMRDENYEPLRPLVNLRNSTQNKFRFVLAGLHNVMRAKNSAADNNPLGQLGSALCIRPLSPFEAQRLLLEPLEYLGFRIDPDRHLETILTATNYYPGVIQYFGYTLLEKFTERCINSGSDEVSPPFPVDDSLLGSVIASQELAEAAAQTLKLSLSLDKYFMLGQCMAYLYYSGGNDEAGAFRGFTVNEIAEADSELTQCMTGESYEAYDAMLREMSDMGILSRLKNGSYRFRRQSFIKSIWPDEDSVLRIGE